MNNRLLIKLLFLLHLCLNSYAQNDSITNTLKQHPKTTDTLLINKKAFIEKSLDPLAPARAAFYSAILPGLGQAYNKKYWKIPIVYAALGTGIYFYVNNDKNYNLVRDIYKRRLAGYTDDEFFGLISNEALQRAQIRYRKDRDLSLLITVGIYILNIVDANVDAHLLQYNVDDQLSLQPHYQIKQTEFKGNSLGLTLNYRF